ncbi:tetratricopeptide repeat protein [Metabacillus halosaccharovorans]|uniref:Tetratricopeptide repeat protein n=1 Tax=Metabacillus halosaccharovorans TaxID=930124 RepID=A0ABT3DNC6_9BACI|nr:tetratricopeptide repeat protein [Metabacillus halosaccharovorans]MCV9888361.1 tetratricopeptide repeat protein [Metabacillus halosaccharovorans]
MFNQVLNEAINLVNKGETEEGLTLLENITPTLHDEEKLQLADQYYQWGIIDKAHEIIEELHFLYPDEIQITLFLAELKIDLENEEEAIELLNMVSKEHESYPHALLLLADLYQMQGLPEVSEQKLKEAKEILPQEPVLDFALGELYFHQGQYNHAISYYQGLLEEHDLISGVNLHQRLAECLSANGQFEEALDHYKQTIESQEDADTLFGYGFTAYQGGFYKTAIQQFLTLKEADPYYTSFYLYLAKAYEQEGLLEESLETVQEGIKVDEYNKDLYLFGGKIAIKVGQIPTAENLLRESLAIDPGHIEAAITLSHVFLQDERYDDVVDLITEIKRYGEDDPQFEWNLARAYHQKEEYTQALKHYDLAYTSFKDQRDFLHEYGYFLLEEGRRQQAKEVFQEILKQDPSNVEIDEILLQLEDEF